ncbi:hypothetical protein ATKI12_6864 [Kitasatospora sp. Ki12]
MIGVADEELSTRLRLVARAGGEPGDGDAPGVGAGAGGGVGA